LQGSGLKFQESIDGRSAIEHFVMAITLPPGSMLTEYAARADATVAQSRF
jgi:hypothetical protein